MNKADLLMASLRQLAASTIVPRGGNTPAAKDGKDKAAQFHEQLRLVSQVAKHAAKPAAETVEPDPLQTAADAVHIADALEQTASARTKDKIKQPHGSARHSADSDGASGPQDWRGPEAALSAAMSKLEQAPKAALANSDVAGVDESQPGEGRRVTEAMPDRPAKTAPVDKAPDQNVKLSVGAAEARGAQTTKVVVREQQTHFEPVQQLPQLQKIVDRVATDLSTAAAPGDTNAGNVGVQDAPHVAGKPVKILTVELDPPNLGTVTVKVRLTGDAVDVQVTADRYETTQMLRHERDALTERMHSAGYNFEISSIDHNRIGDVSASGQMPSRSDHQQSSQQHHQQQGGALINGGSSERQSSDAQPGARQNRQGHDQFAERVARNRDQEPAQDRAGGALYL